MLSVISRWRWQGEARAERVRLASGDGGAVVLDGKGRITLLDASGAAVWTRTVEDSVRDIAIPGAGREAYALSVREMVRFGSTGKALWRVPPPPFPVRLAVRRDGEIVAICAGQGLVRLHEAATGRELGGQRVRHSADHVALLAVELAAPEPPRRGRPGAPPQPQMATLTAVVSERGDVTLLDHTGQPHWHVALGASAGPPDAAHDRVVVPSFDGVHAFLLDGTPAGLYDVGSPTVRALLDDAGQRLLVLDAKQRLFLLSTQTGDTLWSTSLPEETADVSFAGDGHAIAVAMRSGAVERLQVVDGGAASSISSAASGAFMAARGGGAENVAMPAAATIQAPPGGFLEMPEEPNAVRITPKPRWRIPVTAAAPQIALLRSGEGIALLDAARGELSLWTGGETPAWRADRLGANSILAAGMAGDPIVVAGPAGVRFFSFERGPLGPAAQIAANVLAVAESGAAVLVGTAAMRLHLFDGAGKPVWDVPTPGFRRVGISPGGSALAMARDDGAVVFQVRGRKGGWTQSLGGTGYLSREESEGAPTGVEIRVLEQGVLFGTVAGRAGFVGADGAMIFDGHVPGGAGAAEIVSVAGQHLLRDMNGDWSAFRQGPWRLDPLPPSASRVTSKFAMAMDHLLEFRYDSKEIASVDTSTGRLLWKRALGESPKAVAVAADGSCLAAVVSGELVLYDLIASGSPTVTAGGSDTQRFLEL